MPKIGKKDHTTAQLQIIFSTESVDFSTFIPYMSADHQKSGSPERAAAKTIFLKLVVSD